MCEKPAPPGRLMVLQRANCPAERWISRWSTIYVPEREINALSVHISRWSTIQRGDAEAKTCSGAQSGERPSTLCAGTGQTAHPLLLHCQTDKHLVLNPRWGRK